MRACQSTCRCQHLVLEAIFEMWRSFCFENACTNIHARHRASKRKGKKVLPGHGNAVVLVGLCVAFCVNAILERPGRIGLQLPFTLTEMIDKELS